ncbi:MAG: hypothetical protein A2X56_05930 [Nitrospirae bacterium GWC2_57_13]|jgi:hypothetical protein|nr:MAG: hypothetical protein A2072_08235 [Nitrospirae bacterium GWC1_57_7]OGW29264.1 MAG: hypothetical protein A2X56_05930 [Nitrospirae bacterium GWC2_57_13]OGW42338.1 MAG: hypothetical protein A2X57_01355 [Nitrospirae bacterium GWD2_57_8]HAS55418.1 hypothetical protein [Nitrospiraceae bacterium]
MGKRVEKISDTIGRVLARRGMAGKLKEYRIFGQWEKVVGKVVARHARPLSLRGKKLTVLVDSSAWMQQLSQLRPEIIEKANRAFGQDAVESIILKIGEVPYSGSMVRETREAPPLSEQERKQVEEYVRALQDGETREAARRLIETDMRRKKLNKGRV